MTKTLFAVDEDAARKMFVEMGFAAYSKCGRKMLTNRLNDLRNLADRPKTKQPKTEELLDLRDSILAALESKSKIGLNGGPAPTKARTCYAL